MEKGKNAIFFYLIDLLNFFFFIFLLKIGKFQISKMFGKFLEKIAIKYAIPEAAPVAKNSKINDFQEVEKLCYEKKITGNLLSLWKHPPVVSY